MKCPECSFVSSNRKDLCPKCGVDLRPHKKALGLPITQPAANEEDPGAQTEPAPVEAPAVPQGISPTNPEPSTVHSLAPETDVSDELYDIEAALSLLVGDENTVESGGGMHLSSGSSEGGSAISFTAPPPPPTIAALHTETEGDAEEPLFTPSPGSVLDPKEGPEEVDEQDALSTYAQSLEEHVQEAHTAAETLVEKDFPSPQKKSPEATPAVVEFDEDDDALEEQLDAMFGDMVVDVEAVKEPKSSPLDRAKPPAPTTMAVEEDLEISFEVEIEDEDEEEAPAPPPASATPSPTPSTGDTAMDGLVSAFHTLSTETTEISIAPTAPDLDETVARDTEQALSTLAENINTQPPPSRPTLDTLKERVANAGSEEKEVINELLSLVSDVYGIELSVNNLEGAHNDVLKNLEAELEDELGALLSEGTSFLQVTDPVKEAPVAQEEEPLSNTSELEALENELQDELSLLADEGLTIYTDESSRPSSEEGLSYETPVEEHQVETLEEELDQELQEELHDTSYETPAPSPEALSSDVLEALEETDHAEESGSEIVTEEQDLNSYAEELSEITEQEEQLVELLEEHAITEDESSEEISETPTEVTRLPLPDALATGKFLATDLARILEEPRTEEETTEELEVEEEAGEEVVETSSEQEVDIHALWDNVTHELASQRPVEAEEIEISVGELCELPPTARTSLLFSLTEEEILHPEKSRLSQAVSRERTEAKIDTTNLSEALSHYKKAEAAREKAGPSPAAFASKKKSVRKATVSGTTSATNNRQRLHPVAMPRRAVAFAIDVILTLGIGVAIGLVEFFPATMRKRILDCLFSTPDTALAIAQGEHFPPFSMGIAPEELIPIVPTYIGVTLLVWAVANSVLIWTRGGTTGQSMMGLEVVDLDNQPLSYTHSLLRVMSQATTLLTAGAGALLALGPKRRTLHDYMAKTLVVAVPKKSKKKKES